MIDRLGLDMATDLLKEHGFDQFAEILRKACRPTVEEVLPLAIAYRKAYREGLTAFFEANRVSMAYLKAELDDSGYPERTELIRLLLEMPGKLRTQVAWKAREQIRAERQRDREEITGRRQPEPLPISSRVDAFTRAMQSTPPPFRAFAPSELKGVTLECDGIHMEILRYGDEPIYGQYIEAQHPNGYVRRFSGLSLRDVRLIVTTSELSSNDPPPDLRPGFEDDPIRPLMGPAKYVRYDKIVRPSRMTDPDPSS